VFTIEIDQALADAARAFLASRSNVEVICGDAVTELPRLFACHEVGSAIVFLDGHFSGVGTGCGEMPEPAIEELRALRVHSSAIGAIVVDDFRSFGQEPNFPKKSELIRFAEEGFPDFVISIQNDQLSLVRRR
jgi:hypothetical protein